MMMVVKLPEERVAEVAGIAPKSQGILANGATAKLDSETVSSKLLDFANAQLAELECRSLGLQADVAFLRLDAGSFPGEFSVAPERHLVADDQHAPLVPFTR